MQSYSIATYLPFITNIIIINITYYYLVVQILVCVPLFQSAYVHTYYALVLFSNNIY